MEKGAASDSGTEYNWVAVGAALLISELEACIIGLEMVTVGTRVGKVEVREADDATDGMLCTCLTVLLFL